MKLLCSGLILFSLSMTAFAGSATLLLRGRVPASTSLEWEKDGKGSVPRIKSNSRTAQPKVVFEDKKSHRQITIISP